MRDIIVMLPKTLARLPRYFFEMVCHVWQFLKVQVHMYAADRMHYIQCLDYHMSLLITRTENTRSRVLQLSLYVAIDEAQGWNHAIHDKGKQECHVYHSCSNSSRAHIKLTVWVPADWSLGKSVLDWVVYTGIIQMSVGAEGSCELSTLRCFWFSNGLLWCHLMTSDVRYIMMSVLV